MDELENESLDLNPRKLCKKVKGRPQDADLGEEDDSNTVFIDNLPNDEMEIRKQIKLVDKAIL